MHRRSRRELVHRTIGENATIPSSKWRWPGFTLVELLVVVSIVALLISILLPSMQRARKQAQAVVCMTRCRQAGTGTVMYFNLYDTFPPHQMRMREFDPDLPHDIRFRWFDLIAITLSGDEMARRPDMADEEWERFKRNNIYFEFMNCVATDGWDVGRNSSIGVNLRRTPS